jgi:hypothetical protein
VPDDATTEMVGLLREIRDLLRPVADAYQDEFDRRVAAREEERLNKIRALLSTAKRKEAWKLADGSKTQREIAKAAGMDEGGASKYFKSLRELDAVADTPNPTRIVEV